MTNEQLDSCIKEIAAGDRKALRQLYDEMKNPIFLFAMSLLKNYQAAEDVTQETFLNIMQSPYNCKNVRNVRAWVFGIARNCCADNLKKQSKYIFAEAEDLPYNEENSAPYSEMEASAILSDAFEQLNETERTVVYLYLYAGMKQREIAAALDMPYLTVRSRYSYAIKKLKKYLSDEGVQKK